MSHRRTITRVLAPLAVATLAVTAGAAAPASSSPSAPGRLATVGHLAPAAASVPSAAPIAQAALASTACTETGTTSSCDLWAKTGVATLPGGASVNIWGYSSTSADPATLGGPVLIVTAGQTVTITLHNVDLPSATSLSISQQPGLLPDTVGTAAGSSTAYTFTPGPGTYLYEAGLTPDGPRQVAMGLYGALVVRPAGAPLQAYPDPATAFVDEGLLVLSEVDPAFNAAPMSFDMSEFAPKYWLINGKGYPNTDPIATTPGSTVLLRYVNAGLVHHAMGVLGLHETVLAVDGRTRAHPMRLVDQIVPTGGTADAIVTVPSTSPAHYAIYDAAMRLDNNGALVAPGSAASPIAFGGMLTFVAVAGTAAASGPVTSAVAASPNPTTGAAVSLSASATSATSTVSAAEYFVDAIGASGTGTPLTGAFGVSSAALSGTISPVTLAVLTSGNHAIYVHARDAGGLWGAVASTVLALAKTGPAIGGLSLTPSLTDGTVDVSLQATATAAGGQNVASATYDIDGGTAVAFTPLMPANVVSLPATITAATVNGLAQGAHTVHVQATDALGNTGAAGSVTLTVDKSGPVTSAVLTTPNPTNGTIGVQGGTGGAFYQRIDAAVSDASTGGSNLVAAEYFIDAVGANGTGGSMVATDGVFGSPTEAVYALADLYGIAALSDGLHTVYVHGKDAAGNWGPTATTVLTIDKTPPTFTGISLAPNPTNGATTVALTVNGAADAGAGVAGGEYWISPPTATAPAPGGGTPFTGQAASIPVGTLATGTYTVSARVRDAAGNWSTGTGGIRTATLNVAPDAIFANGFDTGTTPWGWTSASTTTTTRLSVTTSAPLVGTRSLQAQGNSANYVQYNFGTAANPASATFDARFYVNPRNNASTGQDVMAAATNGGFGTQLFHVRYRRNGPQPQVQIQVGNTANAAWVNITNNASNRLEVVWQSGSTLQLYVNGALAQTVTAGAGSVASVRLGSVTSGGSSTLEYFDAFAAKRSVSPLIGP